MTAEGLEVPSGSGTILARYVLLSVGPARGIAFLVSDIGGWTPTDRVNAEACEGAVPQ